MNLKEKQGREEMVESAKQVLLSLRALKKFPDSIIAGVEREHGLSDDFLSVNIGTIIRSLDDHYEYQDDISNFLYHMERLGNSIETCGDWSLDQLVEEIDKQEETVARTILGSAYAGREDIDLLIARIENQGAQTGEESALKSIAYEVHELTSAVNQITRDRE